MPNHNFGYANARMRARRSRLYRVDDYAAMRNLQSLDELFHLMRRGLYGQDLDEAHAIYSEAEAVGVAVQRHFARETRKVVGFFDEKFQPLIRLVVRRLTLDTIKVALRAQVLGATGGERVLHLMMPTVDLSVAELQELVNSEGPKAMLDLLATWRLPYAAPLLIAWAKGGATAAGERILPYLEFAVDTWHYVDALPIAESFKKIGKALVSTLRREIDVLNIQTGMRLAGEVASEGELTLWMIPGGRLRTTALADHLFGHGADFWRDAFRETPYGSAIARGFLAYDKTRRLSSVARELEKFLLDQAMREYIRDPLGIGVAIGYLTALRSEAVNLRVIANGLSLGAGRRMMEEALLLVEEQS
jgi:vacuolar-type H+-ATPase subunit C/Vma6